MRRGPRRLLMSAAVAGLVVTGAATASASTAGNSMSGGCFYIGANNAIVTNGNNNGFIGGASTTTSGGTPTNATLQCWILVNGVQSPATFASYSGHGAQSGAWQTAYSASFTDDVELCQQMIWSNGGISPITCKPLSQTGMTDLFVSSGTP